MEETKELNEKDYDNWLAGFGVDKLGVNKRFELFLETIERIDEQHLDASLENKDKK